MHQTRAGTFGGEKKLKRSALESSGRAKTLFDHCFDFFFALLVEDSYGLKAQAARGFEGTR